MVYIRKRAAIAGALALLIVLMTFRMPTALAESWSFIDGNGTTGLNFDTTKSASTPRMVDLNGTLYSVWSESIGSTSQIRVKKYDDATGTWVVADGGASINQNSAKNAINPWLTVYNNELYAAWEEQYSPYWQLRVKKLSGSSWVSVDGNGVEGLNIGANSNARNARLIGYNNELYVVWDEAGGDGINKLRVKKYGGSGSSWSIVDGGAGLNFSASRSAQNAKPKVWNGKLYVTWGESDGVATQVRVKAYNGTSWSWADGGGVQGLNVDKSQGVTNTGLEAYGEGAGDLYLVWSESVNYISKIRIKKYNGTSWTFAEGDASAEGINQKASDSGSLAYLYAFDGKLYAIWQEGNTAKIRVKSFDGTSWTSVDGNGAQGLNKSSTRAALFGYLASHSEASGSSLYAAFVETDGTANQVRVVKMGPSNAAPTASAVSIGGTLKVGNMLTGTYTYGDAESDAEGATTFKWYTASDAAGTGKTAIAGATTSTLALTSAEAGKYIVFEVTPVAAAGTASGTPVSYTSAAAVVDNSAPTASAVSFGGTLKVGNTLTGAYTYGDAESDAEGATTFKWYTASDAAGTGKTAIAGATTSTLALTSAQAGKYIVFEVTPVAAAGTASGTPVSYTSAAAVVDNAAPTASAVSFGGTLKVGNTLTGTYIYADAESDAEGATTFKWYTASDAAGTGKTAIAGATTSTLALTSAQVGKYIIFEVTPVAAAGTTSGTPVTYTSSSAVVDNAAPTASAVSFGGTLKVGHTLTGAYTYGDAESDAEGETTFKWYTASDAAGTGKTAIAGESTSTLALTSAQVGKYIIFEVTPVAAAGTTSGTPVTFTSTSAVVANAAPVVSNVHIAGGIKLGQILTGSYSYTDLEGDAEGLPVFKWYTADDTGGSNKTVIAGATGITLELKAAQYGKYVSFEVTPAASAGTTPGTPVESEALGPVGVNKGDANGDGIISPADALLVTKYVSGKAALTDEQKLMLDMDGDGDVDANDAMLILNIYNGKGA
ncbi:dockerin type I domain-containing protein [Cohnella hashimotonis]|uniref:Dockerin type I domain-containing protein n=1 Tax=Cohnella hashimotonis TaxID=2826895 RepID=A0ABT6TB22_9BACL|nr:dockerin type I domain-containing protein [Cohnella hashimotonis]MDI4643771.1 dockerin type I domain-containing protein [Cohnella hashimotonis]